MTGSNGPEWLSGEVAIVTGAGAGIGRAIALKLAGAGAYVVAADRDASAAAATIDRIGGAEFGEPLTLDVADRNAVSAAFSDVAARRGRIDVIVNNAGVYPMAPIDDVDDATWDRVLTINLLGAFHAMREAVRHMRDGGRVINISSIDSLRPSAAGLGHYGASKAALNAVTRSAAVEYAPRGIRVNAVLPGVIHTEGTSASPEEARAMWAAKTPAGRVGTPEDIAGAVLFLASPLATFVHGHLLVVDGGLTING